MYESILSQPYSLYGQFERLRRELDDVFGVSSLPNGIRSAAPGTFPAVNVGRTATSVEIYAFAPGLDASKIDVTLDRGVLRISGERVSGSLDTLAPPSVESVPVIASSVFPADLDGRQAEDQRSGSCVLYSVVLVTREQRPTRRSQGRSVWIERLRSRSSCALPSAAKNAADARKPA